MFQKWNINGAQVYRYADKILAETVYLEFRYIAKLKQSIPYLHL